MTPSSSSSSDGPSAGPIPNNPACHRVALMGFGGFEQQALDAYLRIANDRSPAYQPVASVEDAHFIVANGERSGVLDVIVTAQRMGDTILVGDAPRQGAAAWLERPIDPLHLFRALDTAVKRKDMAQNIARSTAQQMSHADVHDAWSREALAPTSNASTQARRSPLSAHHPLSGAALTLDSTLARGLSNHPARTLQALVKRVPPGPGEPLLALIVDGDDDASLDVAKALQAHGISSERVADSSGAFSALAAQVFDLIVVDVALRESSALDGLSLTQALHRQARAPSEACPPLFVTSNASSSLEHAQAHLAGAMCYLSKPVDAQALQGALADAELRVSMTAPSDAARVA